MDSRTLGIFGTLTLSELFGLWSFGFLGFSGTSLGAFGNSVAFGTFAIFETFLTFGIIGPFGHLGF